MSMQSEVNLETHVEDVVRLIDSLDTPQVVLVGHDYAIHPVLGAADLLPERVARIAHLDAGLPQHGDPALALVPDPVVHQLPVSVGVDGPPQVLLLPVDLHEDLVQVPLVPGPGPTAA
ncbi:alpha/beta fold hydrolase [Streptomyces sp. NPDC056309]|uniref:alpha/beta fold hydrolase n=1 Tax=unclassified Streptomyces TaxID=2593676 RepID=UPI0035D54233